MEETRLYLFSRLKHLVKVLDFLYDERNDVDSLLAKRGQFDAVETVFLSLSRRSAYLPSQVDGTLQEAVRLVQNLRELNSVAVTLTGGLANVPPLNPSRPKTPLVDRAVNAPFVSAQDVEPTRAHRPTIKTAKSHADLKPDAKYSGHREQQGTNHV